MKLAILHHHLNRGGVTQVVVNHVRALQAVGRASDVAEILALHGGRAEGWPESDEPWGPIPVRVAAVDGLDYDRAPQLDIDTLTDRILRTLSAAGCGPQETILHVHNHSLGKNVSLPGAVRRLAEHGYRILLQIHDFAEDWRPNNFNRFQQAMPAASVQEIGRYLYPEASQIHYALLNRRDRRIVLDGEADPGRVHFLPNPASVAGSLPSREDAFRRFCRIHGLTNTGQLVLYPVRGIRRKNLGELLLWAAIAAPGTTFAVTLPATSEVEVPSFHRWTQLAGELDLPVLFNVGLQEGMSFEENLAAADRMITTSVAEGFGLVFLECWLHHRPLIGRNLAEITQDFCEQGLQLDHLGNSLDVPVAWIGAEAFVAGALEFHHGLCRAYGQPLDPDSETKLRARIAGGMIDFAALTTSQQAAVIRRAVGDSSAAAEILNANPWMRTALQRSPADWQERVAANAAVVRTEFSLATCGRRLQTIYGTLFASRQDDVASIRQPLNILRSFLDIDRLCPLRIEP